MKVRILCGAVSAVTLTLAGSEALSADKGVIDLRSQSAVEQEVRGMSSAMGLSASDATEDHHELSACKRLDLTAEQKETLRQSIVSYVKEKIRLEAKIKTAKIDYASEVFKVDGDRATALNAGSTLVDAKSELVAGKVNFATTVLFDILTPEQRKDGFICMKQMAHAKRHHQRDDQGDHGHEGFMGLQR